MSQLSDNAKKYAQEVLEPDREELVLMLENIGVACYDDEDTSTLAESAVDSIEAGDIEFDFSFAASKSYCHHIQMMWLDIEEVWV